MRRPDKYRRVFFFIVATLIACPCTFAQEACDDSFRWDLQMIREAPIWQNLLVNYSYADHRERWPERKRALELILEKHPQSQWADDAALILACGKANFEDNTKGALADLRKLIREYPYGQTVVVHWDREDGCILDDVWLTRQGGLVFLNPDNSVRASNPFSRDGITQREKETLAYFRHLRQFPRSTQVMAKLILSNILIMEGQESQAASVLNDIVSTSRTYLALVNRADKRAAVRPDGYLISNLTYRPEYHAHLSLMWHYEKQGALEKSFEVAQQLIKLASDDGWLWTINRQIGDFYGRNRQLDRANTQYKLALVGLKKHQGILKKRSEMVQGSEIPEDFWSTTQKEIERKIRASQR